MDEIEKYISLMAMGGQWTAEVLILPLISKRSDNNFVLESRCDFIFAQLFYYLLEHHSHLREHIEINLFTD